MKTKTPMMISYLLRLLSVTFFVSSVPAPLSESFELKFRTTCFFRATSYRIICQFKTKRRKWSQRDYIPLSKNLQFPYPSLITSVSEPFYKFEDHLSILSNIGETFRKKRRPQQNASKAKIESLSHHKAPFSKLIIN